MHKWFANQKLQIIFLENVIGVFVRLANLLENGFPMKLVTVNKQSKCWGDTARAWPQYPINMAVPSNVIGCTVQGICKSPNALDSEICW